MSKPAGVFLQLLGLCGVLVMASNFMSGDVGAGIFYGLCATALLYWGRQPVRDAKRARN